MEVKYQQCHLIRRPAVNGIIFRFMIRNFEMERDYGVIYYPELTAELCQTLIRDFKFQLTSSNDGGKVFGDFLVFQFNNLISRWNIIH